jgi:hypothetical protein
MSLNERHLDFQLHRRSMHLSSLQEKYYISVRASVRASANGVPRHGAPPQRSGVQRALIEMAGMNREANCAWMAPANREADRAWMAPANREADRAWMAPSAFPQFASSNLIVTQQHAKIACPLREHLKTREIELHPKTRIFLTLAYHVENRPFKFPIGGPDHRFVKPLTKKLHAAVAFSMPSRSS